MAVKKAVKKVVEKITAKVTVEKPVVTVTKSETKENKCTNCTSKGEQCSICTPIFVDKFA